MQDVGGEVKFSATSSNADVLKLKPSDGNIPHHRILTVTSTFHTSKYTGAVVRAKLKIVSPHSSENRLYVDQPLQTTIKPQDKKRCLAMAPQLFLQSTNYYRSKYGNFPYALILSIT
jgi:hypothetical protein